MKLSRYRVLGALGALVAVTPNLNWYYYYLPLTTIFTLLAFGAVRPLPKKEILYTSIIMLPLLAASFLSPISIKYNLLFFLVMASSFLLVKMWDKVKFRNAFLRVSSIGMMLTIIIEMNFDISPYLQSRPDFDSHLLGYFRQRGFFTEPAYLGYWCAFLSLVAIIYRRWIDFVILFLGLLLSASAGAALFFIASSAIFFVTLTFFQTTLALSMCLAIYIIFSDFFYHKLSTNSYSNRLENITLSLEYIAEHFPAPMGFGPISVSYEEVGVTSFFLLVLKAFSVMSIVFLPLIILAYRAPMVLLPFGIIGSAVGNFWEAPIILTMLLFYTIVNPELQYPRPPRRLYSKSI